MPDAPFDAVICDLDGTLLDTESLCNDTGVEACGLLGHPVSMEFFQSLVGIHDAERARIISAEVGRQIDVGAFYALWDRLTFARFETGLPLKPGAMALLAAIDRGGLPLGLATSSRRVPAQTKLRHSGLRGFFRAVVTCDDVARAKPAPDAYLTAAAMLGATPARCLVFEDSDTGAEAAHAAGMTVVQVPDGHGATGRFAHMVAPDLLSGAAAAGLNLAGETVPTP